MISSVTVSLLLHPLFVPLCLENLPDDLFLYWSVVVYLFTLIGVVFTFLVELRRENWKIMYRLRNSEESYNKQRDAVFCHSLMHVRLFVLFVYFTHKTEHPVCEHFHNHVHLTYTCLNTQCTHIVITITRSWARAHWFSSLYFPNFQVKTWVL